MNRSLTPEDILNDVTSGDLNKKVAIDLLISLIENSNDADIRIKCLRVFESIDMKCDEVFNLLESCLLSDKSEQVRAKASQLLIFDYAKKSVKSLKWAIQNEKSLTVLDAIEELLAISCNNYVAALKDEIDKRRKKLSKN